MKKSKLFSTPVKSILLATLIISALMAWDWIELNYASTEEGTFCPESDFDSVTAIPAIVSIVPSDYEGLSSPVSRSSDALTDTQIDEMVSKAIELQGGFENVINKGDVVLLKPNLVGADCAPGEGENTDVRVIKALIRIIDDFTDGDVEIIVGEGTARSNDDPLVSGSVWENSEYTNLLTDPDLTGINFRLLNLNQTIDSLVEVDLGYKSMAAPHGGKYKVHKAVINADVYITVPVLKIHNTGMTCALKNQIGLAPGCYYGYNKMKGTAAKLFHDQEQRRWTDEEIVDLSNIANIDFVVVDALMCLETEKTDRTTNRVRFNTIMAGKDPVAIDHVACKLFCLNPDDMNHITLAEKLGFGTNNSDLITIVGATVDNTKICVKKNIEPNGLFGQSCRTWLISQAYSGTDITNEYITNEAACIPEQKKDGWSEPIYFFDDRIDLYSYFGGSGNITSYAYANFDAPKAQTAELWVGCNGGMYVYLNGVKVFGKTSMILPTTEIANYSTNISIKEGKNTLLVKTSHASSDYSFALNICEPESETVYSQNRVSGLIFYQDTTTTTNPIDTNTTGIEYTYRDSYLKAYPNPCSSQTLIEFESRDNKTETISIYDINGQLVRSFNVKPVKGQVERILWDLTTNKGQQLPAGQYFITNQNHNTTVRIIIE